MIIFLYLPKRLLTYDFPKDNISSISAYAAGLHNGREPDSTGQYCGCAAGGTAPLGLHPRGRNRDGSEQVAAGVSGPVLVHQQLLAVPFVQGAVPALAEPRGRPGTVQPLHRGPAGRRDR